MEDIQKVHPMNVGLSTKRNDEIVNNWVNGNRVDAAIAVRKLSAKRAVQLALCTGLSGDEEYSFRSFVVQALDGRFTR